MKIMLKIWVLLGAIAAVAYAQSQYSSGYLTKDYYSDPEGASYHPSDGEYHQSRSYDSSSHDGVPSNNPKYYQSVDSKHSKPETEVYPRYSSYHAEPQQVQYYQPEDPSYHRPQEISHRPEIPSYHRPQEISHHQPESPPYHRPQEISHQPEISSYHRPQEIAHQPEIPSYHRPQETGDKPELPSYKRLREIAYKKSGQGSDEYSEPEDKHDAEDEPEYAKAPVKSSSPHPAPVPVDPKLPLYFTMYEKRVVADPADKYGKGPWRFLTYGHGITYGSKEPGKVFEKGYGYIRALGRDHCKLPDHLCPPKDGKPFEYVGRKEPYFGYRPH